MFDKTIDKVGTVSTSSPTLITIWFSGLDTIEFKKNHLQIGKFLKIEDGNHNFAIASIANISSSQIQNPEGTYEWHFTISTNPIGALLWDSAKDNYIFKRGTHVLPVPTEPAYILNENDLSCIYGKIEGQNHKLGELVGAPNIDFLVNGNKFFGKHIGIVGSTGSGKSCAVASLLHSIVGIKNKVNKNIELQKNSHIVIIDVHSEYRAAFELDAKQNFALNYLCVENLSLPYWLMNSEELEAIFIDSNESNSHNQISQFKRAVVLNKERHNPNLTTVTYDSPCYFDIREVLNYIKNKNDLTTYEENGTTYLAVLGKKLEYLEANLWQSLSFEASSGNSKHLILNVKVGKDGGFNGEFNRFISRFETKLNDKRLEFIINPAFNGKTPKTEDFQDLLIQLLGYNNSANITILDVSGIPFEVLSITVSLIARMLFDFSFHYSKEKHSNGMTSEIPFLLVCEEAHIYIPKASGQEFKASKRSIERIAKEGRKYGLSLMVVSQRPSEVSETIFSQCSNFIVLRLMNNNDQNYIKSLLTESSSSLVDLLPSLGQAEALVVGDSVVMPSLVQLPRPDPEPQSATVDVYSRWNQPWKNEDFLSVVRRWAKI